MTLTSITQRLEKHLKRIEECESIGMWDFAAYFIGESAAETETAANTYQSVVSGLQSGIERAAVNTWFEEEKVESILNISKISCILVFYTRGLIMMKSGRRL